MKITHLAIKCCLLMIAIGGFSFVKAQELTKHEVMRLYEDGHYERCIHRASNYSKRHPKDAIGYLLVGLSNLQLFFVSDGDDADDLLNDAMQYTQLARQRDTNGKDFQPYDWELNELYRLIRQKGNELYTGNKKAASGTYFKYLASIYNDTTAEYADLFPSSIKENGNYELGALDIRANLEDKLIKYAESLMGAHYHYSGTSEQGFDCSGYVCYVFKAHDIDLPHGSNSMAMLGKQVSINNARPGDLIFFGSKHGNSYHTSHVGIIHSNDGNGNFTFIHSSTSAGVTIDGPNTISWDYWKNKILFIKRVIN